MSGPEEHLPLAADWFAEGERMRYDRATGTVGAPIGGLRVFVRHEGDLSRAVTFMPGYPDGSFGWAKVLPFLPEASAMPKLFFDYVGMGDSDKPKELVYGTPERTDLVEALWRDLGVQSTLLVAFDFSSLVVIEHLRRRLERTRRGEVMDGPRIEGVLIFNGGLFTDGHTHPWTTTPLLRRLPVRARGRLGNSLGLFKLMAGGMWSRRYGVSDGEVRELMNALGRHEGMFYLAAGAGFVADHKAAGSRLDFGEMFTAYRHEFPFLVGGSDEDPFEHRQVDMAEQKLSRMGLQIARLPGGHLTTHEQPKALAGLIERFAGQARSWPR